MVFSVVAPKLWNSLSPERIVSFLYHLPLVGKAIIALPPLDQISTTDPILPLGWRLGEKLHTDRGL